MAHILQRAFCCRLIDWLAVSVAVSCAGLENLSHSLFENSIETSCHSLLLFKGSPLFRLWLSVRLCKSVLSP